jgi:signal transduction histidine kinase
MAERRMADADDSLQDSRLPDGRFFARFMASGVLVLDARDELRFASPAACALLGVENEAALRARFPDVAKQLHLSGRDVSAAPHYGRADVQTDAGTCAIRFEMHTVANAGAPMHVLFVRDRARLLASDGTLLLASEAHANRHVLTGLVHAAKGPLNNFSLTLALLEAGLARARESSPTPDLLARFDRYVEVLRNETTRLAGCVDDIHALTLPVRGERDAVDLGALARDCAAVLRHGATMREVALHVDAPDPPPFGMAERLLLRRALLCAATTVIDCTAPHGSVVLGAASDDAMAALRVVSTEPALPTSLAACVFQVACIAESDHSAATAARVIVEAQGGEFSLVRDAPGFSLRIPARPA